MKSEKMRSKEILKGLYKRMSAIVENFEEQKDNRSKERIRKNIEDLNKNSLD